MRLIATFDRCRRIRERILKQISKKERKDNSQPRACVCVLCACAERYGHSTQEFQQASRPPATKEGCGRKKGKIKIEYSIEISLARPSAICSQVRDKARGAAAQRNATQRRRPTTTHFHLKKNRKGKRDHRVCLACACASCVCVKIGIGEKRVPPAQTRTHLQRKKRPTECADELQSVLYNCTSSAPRRRTLAWSGPR